MIIQEFQSTRPVWGVTVLAQRWVVRADISIHTPRVGRDLWSSLSSTLFMTHFNPHAPCGA